MKNHKLILILKTLSKKEINAFVRMVSTPYFNRKEEVILLVVFLKKYYPKFQENLIKKEKIFNAINKEKTFNKRFLDDTVYYTIKLLEKFMVLEHLNNNSFTNSKILSKELRNRKLNVLSLKELEKSKKIFSNENLNFESDYELYFISLDEYLEPNNKFKSDYIEPLLNANKFLDLHYWKNKLWINSELLSRREINNDLEEVLTEFQLNQIEKVLINYDDLILQVLYFLNANNDKYSLGEIFDKLNEKFVFLEKKIQLLILVGLINYCKKQYTKTQDAVFTKYWFDFYKFGYEKNVFQKVNSRLDTTFINIVHLGLVNNEFEWVAYFIEDYEKYIKDKMLLKLGRAMLNFKLENYNLVLSELLALNFGHIHQNLTSRSLIAKTYYKMKEYDLLDNHLKAFDLYLRRQKELSKQLMQVNLNFITAVKKLMLLQYDKKALVSLNKYLKEKPIAYKRWILGEI
ncbi:MAG: hypothetical protein ACPGVH_02520 [Chitinophagales bacterium]